MKRVDLEYLTKRDKDGTLTRLRELYEDIDQLSETEYYKQKSLIMRANYPSNPDLW